MPTISILFFLVGKWIRVSDSTLPSHCMVIDVYIIYIYFYHSTQYLVLISNYCYMHLIFVSWILFSVMNFKIYGIYLICRKKVIFLKTLPTLVWYYHAFFSLSPCPYCDIQIIQLFLILYWRQVEPFAAPLSPVYTV